jgi:predicted nucleic acid-binding protein
MATYYDTSALVKLVQHESESAALQSYFQARADPVTSALARTELLRAVKDGPAILKSQARQLLATLDLILLDDRLLDVAAELDSSILRTLDAIHLAAALSLGDALLEVVTYDHRMIISAHNLGLATASPGALAVPSAEG